jgi:aspartate dehydrogenase
VTSIRVAIAGLGAIGRVVARRLSAGIPGLALSAVAARDHAKAQAWLAAEGIAAPLIELAALPEHCDLAVECAPAAVLEEICRPMLSAGKRVMVLSAGALLARPDLIELAKSSGGQIIVPTGALLGLDAVTAAAEGKIQSVRMITRKPPNGLAGAPYLVEHGISVAGLNAAKQVFVGSAREAAKGFPANVNVVAALALGGIGPDRTEIEIWADPAISRNCHAIEVESDSARLSFAIENVPSENPKTGRITSLSVVAALRKLQAPLRVGT